MEYGEYNLSLKAEPTYEVPPTNSFVTNIDELNLNDELLHHYLNTKAFLQLVQADDEVPPNQVAQLMNSLSAILQHIVKMKETIHNVERMKALEETVIEVMKEQPEDLRNTFFQQLELALGRLEK